ncbi:MAG: hypothetical protein WKG07_32505 [Hymenobacter sp.]
MLSLEEKFLAGEGQNITPARYAADPAERQRISTEVKAGAAPAWPRCWALRATPALTPLCGCGRRGGRSAHY